MITFAEFKTQAESRGYEPRVDPCRPELFIIHSKNRVKVEINTKAGTYIAGYNIPPEHRLQLKDALASSGLFQMKFSGRSLAYAEYGGLEKFWLWVSIIEGVDFEAIERESTPITQSIPSDAIPMVSFEEFSSQCQARGYKGSIQAHRPELFVIRTKNGVKVEINTKLRNYVAGYGLDEEERIALRAELTRQEELGVFELKSTTTKSIFAKYEGMDKFWRWVEIIENIESIVASTRGFATKLFSREQADERIFEKIARTYQFAIRLEHQNLLDTSRILLEADKLDHLITVGKSANAPEDRPYREHIVPCVMIHNEVIRLLLHAGVRDHEVSEEVIHQAASLIKNNLAIVLISKEEQEKLDISLGLRTSMPKDWKFGDSIFARLEAAELEWESLDESS